MSICPECLEEWDGEEGRICDECVDHQQMEEEIADEEHRESLKDMNGGKE